MNNRFVTLVDRASHFILMTGRWSAFWSNLFPGLSKSPLDDAKEHMKMLQSRPFDINRTVIVVPPRDFREQLEEASKSDLNKRIMLKWMYVKDPYCLDWDYDQAKRMPPTDEMFTLRYATEEDLNQHRREILEWTCAQYVIGMFLDSAVQGCYNPAEALVCLKGGLDGLGVNKAALFRYELVWSIWGSSRAFWEGVLKVYAKHEGHYNLLWPETVPNMTTTQVFEYFQEDDNDEGCKLIKMIILRNGPDFPITKYARHLVCLYQDDEKDH